MYLSRLLIFQKIRCRLHCFDNFKDVNAFNKDPLIKLYWLR